MSVYHSLEYDGTGVNLADVLPVPRCRLPLGSKQNMRSRIRGPQNNGPSRKSHGHGSPLEVLRRQDERGEDEQPSDSHIDTMKACILPGVFAIFLVSFGAVARCTAELQGVLVLSHRASLSPCLQALAHHKRDVQPTPGGATELRTRQLRQHVWQSGTPNRHDLWDTFVASQQNSHSGSSRLHYADSLGGGIHIA